MARKKKNQVIESAETDHQHAAVTAPVESDVATASQESAESKPRGQFRSWVTDANRGYTRLTDQHHGLIVLLFTEKPEPDVLEAVKAAGFQYRPDHDGQKNAWVRRNDAQGRLAVESVEKLIRGTSNHREA